LALIFGPIYSGWVFDTFSPQTVLFVGAGVMLPGVGLALVLQKMSGSSSASEDCSVSELVGPKGG